MQISKNSWHYKLYRHYDYSFFYDKTNLCSYVQGLVLLMIKTFFLYVLVFPALLIIFTFIMSPFMLIFGYYPNYKSFTTIFYKIILVLTVPTLGMLNALFALFYTNY